MSGVGDDVNPCSRTAPCKTFAGAISKTATGGEINCLDPGAFGAVTITKSMSIVCQYTEAGVLATLGSNGIVVNAPAGSVVYLSGLDIFGAGTGLNGIRFIGGSSLTVENSSIRGFGNANGNGVSFAPTGTSFLNITNTSISNNGSGATGGGILVQPAAGAAGNARVTLRNVRIQGNANQGLRFDTTGNTSAAGIRGTIDDSSVSGSTTGISITTPAGASGIRLLVNNVTVNENGTGLNASGALAGMLVANSTVVSNTLGVSASGGAVMNTYNNNRVDGNDTDGNFNLPALPPS